MSFADVLLHGRTYHILVYTHTHTHSLSLSLSFSHPPSRPCVHGFEKRMSMHGHVSERICACTRVRSDARARVCVTYARRTTTTRRRRRRLRVCFHGYHRRGTRAVRLQPLFDDDVPEDREGLSRKELAAGELRVRKASISPVCSHPARSLLPSAFAAFLLYLFCPNHEPAK